MSDAKDRKGTVVKLIDRNAPSDTKMRKRGTRVKVQGPEGEVYEGRIIACLKEASKKDPTLRDITTSVMITGPAVHPAAQTDGERFEE